MAFRGGCTRIDVQDIPTTEEEDVLLELRFERDCCSF